MRHPDGRAHLSEEFHDAQRNQRDAPFTSRDAELASCDAISPGLDSPQTPTDPASVTLVTLVTQSSPRRRETWRRIRSRLNETSIPTARRFGASRRSAADSARGFPGQRATRLVSPETGPTRTSKSSEGVPSQYVSIVSSPWTAAATGEVSSA